MANEDKVRKIAKLRTILEKRLQEMETELDGLRALLEFTDSVLLETGFKRAEIPKPAFPISPKSAAKSEEAVPIRTVTGELLANIYVEEGCMRIVPDEKREFNINTPPFSSFFVEGVLTKMQNKDREAAMRGEIPPDKVLFYDVALEGDLIREITIRNVTPERLQDIKSAIRWTLEKMYEKTRSNT
jgi:hypothetical protein